MDKLTALIAKHEGLRLFPYKDTVGKLTIGYGRNLDDVGISQEMAKQVLIDAGITQDMADAMLVEDVSQSIKECQKFEWFEDLNEVRQAVIVNMVFNLGITRFKKFKKTITYLASCNPGYAANEMLDSKWARQVGRRSAELSNMMFYDHWYHDK